jgi:hypothetical protein
MTNERRAKEYKKMLLNYDIDKHDFDYPRYNGKIPFDYHITDDAKHLFKNKVALREGIPVTYLEVHIPWQMFVGVEEEYVLQEEVKRMIRKVMLETMSRIGGFTGFIISTAFLRYAKKANGIGISMCLVLI